MHVLIVNAIMMGDNNATGITMKNMLYGIKNVEYLQLCVDYRVNAHEQLVETLFIGLDNAPADKMVWHLKGKPEFSVNKEIAKSEQLVSLAGKRGKLGEFLKGIVDSVPVSLDDEQYKKINDFKPDLIYTMGASMHVMRLALKLSKKLEIPIVFHCMDDWKSTIYTKSILSYPFRKETLSLLKSINNRGKINLAICEKMANYYAKEYRKKYNYASNCIFEFNEVPYSADDKKSMLMIFSGGLHFGRGERLKEVAEVIDELNKAGKRIELEVFAPSSQVSIFEKEFSEFEHTRLLTYVEQHKQMENLCRADILLHVESNDLTEMQYMQYSFSTKLVEYFATGRTVIGFGSKTLSSIEYIEKMKCGMIAEKSDELKAKIMTLYDRPDLLEEFSKRSLDVAVNYHSQEAVQKTILDTFLFAVQ